jgi:hypothetical protein
MMRRRQFLRGGMGAAILAARSADLFAQDPQRRADPSWDAGEVGHLLPTVSDTRILLKASFTRPQAAAPMLRIGSSTFTGAMNDSEGAFWEFHASGLQPGRQYSLSLAASDGKNLCEPWNLSTFPARTSTPDSFRVLFFTCAGGPENFTGNPEDALTTGNLPTAVRNRLLRRALSFQPQAAVANGDHVYWDLHTPRLPPGRQNDARERSFNRSALIFGDTNETVLKRAAGQQIIPVYGTDFRSTPVFFVQDDHDYFDNDEALDEMVTMPPVWFQLQLARATQKLYYPEFLPDEGRSLGLPWGSAGPGAVSESAGTIRYGRLAEVLLYDVRRMCTLAGRNAVFLDPQVERWLLERTTSLEVTHVVHGPSNPMGWSAGKWMEWYPDVLDPQGRLTTQVAKPFWQSGWMMQHDRLVAAMTGRRGRIPLTISGDLHAVAIGKITRAGSMNLENPLNAVLAGPIGTSPGGWPSAYRAVGPTPPLSIDMQQELKPIEQHGFTIIDFLPDRIRLRFFKWDIKTQSPAAIDTLQPFHTTEIGRPV